MIKTPYISKADAHYSDNTVPSHQWQDDCVLLLMTYSKMEHLVSEALLNLELFWPGRPETFVVTDGELRGDNIIHSSQPTFVELLAFAVQRIKLERPQASNVFVLLEDLTPLGPVDEALLLSAQELRITGGFKYVGHRWEADASKPWKRGEWSVENAPAKDDVEFVPIPKDWNFYNNLCPSVWDINYLSDLLQNKIAIGALDPWAFESPVAECQADHFLIEAIWPTVKDGAYRKGNLNVKAVLNPDFPSSPLMDKLRKEYCGSKFRTVARLKRKRNRLYKNLIAPLTKKSTLANRGHGN